MKIQKIVLRLLMILLTLVISGYALLCIVYLLPIKRIEQNVKNSADIFAIEGLYPQLVNGVASAQLDNFTDATMLLEACHKSEYPFYEAALLNEKAQATGMYPTDIVAQSTEKGLTGYDSFNYGRYWHGYLVFLKPLLLVFSLHQIRYIQMMMHIILYTSVVMLIAKKESGISLIPMVALWFFLSPAALFLSLQYNAVFIIMMVELILILVFDKKYAEKGNLWIYHFFIAGALTSYFDFLTYPLVTLGIPISYLLWKNGKSFKESFILLIETSISWGLGYALMWGSKWGIASLLTNENFISDAYRSILTRTSHESQKSLIVSYIDVVKRNTNIFFIAFFMIAFIGSVIGIVLRKKLHKKNFVLLIIAIMPFAWYFVLNNHSYNHTWFTYRELGISVYSLLLFGVSCFEQTKFVQKNVCV